jgi:RNA polymerase sigma factor (TIGR02999 family)
MSEGGSHQISILLADWSKGDEGALEQLMPLVYDELRRMARGYMRRQAADHIFQTTELIHEAYLKLAKSGGHDFQNRAHFFGVAAKAMRHILVDYARSKQSDKRGGGRERIYFTDDTAVSFERTDQLVALDGALKDLELLDARKCRVVELRFFGGLTTDEIAETLQISSETVKRDWRFSRNWLLRQLAGGD